MNVSSGTNHLHVHQWRKRRKYRHLIDISEPWAIVLRPDYGGSFNSYIHSLYATYTITVFNRYARISVVFYRRKPKKRKNNLNCRKHYVETLTGVK